jgi:hypothetical protein
VADGQPLREAARRFGMSVSAVKRSVVRLQETGSLERMPLPGGPRTIGREQEALLWARLQATPMPPCRSTAPGGPSTRGQQHALADAVEGHPSAGLDANTKGLTAGPARRSTARRLAGGGRPARPTAVRRGRRKRHPPRLDAALRLGTARPAGAQEQCHAPWQDHHRGGGARARRRARTLADRGGDGDGDLRMGHHGAVGTNAAARAGGGARPSERTRRPPLARRWRRAAARGSSCRPPPRTARRSRRRSPSARRSCGDWARAPRKPSRKPSVAPSRPSPPKMQSLGSPMPVTTCLFKALESCSRARRSL